MVRRWRNSLQTVPRHARWLLILGPCIVIPLTGFGGFLLCMFVLNVYGFGRSIAATAVLMVLLVVVNALIIFMIVRRVHRLRDRVRAANGAICCTCGYDLSGFESERPIDAHASEGEVQQACPECGDVFDLEDVKRRWRGCIK